MASLPSIAVAGTLKLEPELRRYTFTEKSPTISYPKTQSISHLDASLDKRSLDLREVLSMLRNGTRVESYFYIPLLQECVGNNSLSNAQTVHAHIVKTGTDEDVFVMTFLVNVYAKCGRMEDARKVFDHTPRRNAVTWTALMTGYVQNLQPDPAIRIFLKMLEVGAYPTRYTFGTILRACSSLLLIKLGMQIHAYIVKYGVERDTSTGNSLCSFYTKCGSFDSAINAFRRIGEKNVISWTTVISACCDYGEPAVGLRYFVQMLSEDLVLNEFTFTSILSLCCSMQALEIGTQIHSMSIKLGYLSNLPIKNSIMYLYLKCGLVDEAHKLFNRMETISLVTWNAMIAGHAQVMDLANDDISAYHSGNEALNILVRMNRSGLRPDLFTFSSILTVCGSLVSLVQGEQIHAQTIKSGFLSDVVLGTSLVDMYNKCGSIERAQKAFLEMPSRTLVSWTSMITAFAQHGHSQQALQLFEDMRMAGKKPNKVTFIGVLSACSNAGMVDKALRYFEMMKNQYKIKPIMNHYACLINMFVRLDQLEEAFHLTQKMGTEPGEFIWSILFAGCRRQGNLELGFYAAEQLLKFKPKDPETYVMLLNMYLSVEKWQDVSRLRKLMRDEKLGKLKDWSRISIRDKVYSFKPNNQLHASRTEVESYLGSLLKEVKSLGYQPPHFVLTDEDDDKMGVPPSSTLRHSEKFACIWVVEHTKCCTNTGCQKY
ncbi:hypothetical protein Nepgr_025762 [Nepenthes gracilis]|uniref:Pentatricopeptide repeat-containing protein n=1 Tax=Nepenthes gracilis TaxID=150966 RepID=A0AAD3T703_NEPGR|nr:hypothetical protein Nepgr_025762 [Nepenthes gracilis]